jgi:hypothetical protein
MTALSFISSSGSVVTAVERCKGQLRFDRRHFRDLSYFRAKMQARSRFVEQLFFEELSPNLLRCFVQTKIVGGNDWSHGDSSRC